MRWESEKWRKLYRRVDATWLKLPVLARGLGSELLKYADDDGRVALQEDEETGEGLCRVMGAHKTERKLVSELAQKLLADGYIVREAGAVLIRNFVRAQARSSNAERQARYRQRHAGSEGGDVGDADETATGALYTNEEGNVTSNGQSNAAVTVTLPNEVTDRALSLSLSEIAGSLSADLKKEVPVTARARDSEQCAKLGEQAALPGVEPPAARRRRARAPASKAQVGEHPLPADWEPTEAHRSFAASRGIDLEAEVFGFRGWAEGKVAVKWNGVFSTRLANNVKWAKERGETRGPRGSFPQPGPMQVRDREVVPPEEQEKSLV